MRFALLFLLLIWTQTGCTKTYYVQTGLPADVASRFFFHLEKEAQDRGLRTQRSEVDLHVYAQEGQLWYQIDGDEIIASIVIPQKSAANSNYYRQKKRELESLHAELSDGARKRSRNARDFY